MVLGASVASGSGILGTRVASGVLDTGIASGCPRTDVDSRREGGFWGSGHQHSLQYSSELMPEL